MQKKECSVVFFDVRNFTSMTSEYGNEESFYKLIEMVYKVGLNISENLSPDVKPYINSTGDGFLCIFFGKDHYLKAYLMGLLLLKKMRCSFDEYMTALGKDLLPEDEYYYGVGVESGSVVRVGANCQKNSIETFLGGVINEAARLESLTKDYGRTGMVFGPKLNKFLVKRLIGEEYDYEHITEKVKQEVKLDVAKEVHQAMQTINEELLSMYMFERRLKGVEKSIPTFRISPTLLKRIDLEHWSMQEKFPESLYKSFLTLLK